MQQTMPLPFTAACAPIPVREIADLRLPRLQELAGLLGKDIAIFDLETTTLPKFATFGITEACVLRVPAVGPVVMHCDLVNPENPIAPEVVRLTGITDEMVASAQTFAAWTGLFAEIATNALVLGFNSDGFDVPAAKGQGARYGAVIEFADTIDTRKRYVEFVRGSGNGQRGTLAGVMELFGIAPFGDFHRAAGDAVGTALWAETILLHYGIAGLLGRPLHPMPERNENPHASAKIGWDATQLAVLEEIRRNGYDRMRIASALRISINKAADCAWDLYHGGKVRLEDIADDGIQAWLRERIRPAVEEAWDEKDYGRYSPVRNILKCEADCPDVDYTQLKVALTRAGLR